MIHFVFVGQKKEIKNEEYLIGAIESIKDIIDSSFEYTYDSDNTLLRSELSNIDDNQCSLFMDIATYDSVKQLTIQINIIDPENFNELAYKLKKVVKDVLMKDWKECVWLEDSQSALFAQQLYSKIYITENRLREFINIVMVKEVGITWWENYVSNKLSNTYGARHKHLRVTAPLYKNVDARLLSIDTDHLTSIMKYQQKRWNPQYNEEIEKLINSNDQSNVHALKMKLQEQLEVKIDSWDLIFSNYFDENFLEEWEDFCKNRNHIAHNKLIDKIANSAIRKNVENIQTKIDKAFEIHYSLKQSDEDIIELNSFREELERESMEADSNIEMKSSGEIHEIFQEELDEIVQEIENEFHFRNDLEILNENNNDSLKFKIISMTSKLFKGVSIELEVNIQIDNSPGASSNVILKLFVMNKVEKCYEIIYENGEAFFNEEQSNYMPMKDNALLSLDKTKLIEDFNHLVEIYFPNTVEEIASWNYSSVKDGGMPAVGEFPCEECEEDTVSINNSFYEFGICVSCGYDQSESIKSCERCQSYYNWNIEGGEIFCDSCEAYMKGK